MLRRPTLGLEIGAPKLEDEPLCRVDVADDVVALARTILARLAAKPDQRRHADLPAILGAGAAVDQAIVALRQVALRLLRIAVIERRRDHEAEHSVAEEFEPLIAA